MPRYFFDVYEPEASTVDIDGLQLSDVEAVRAEAGRVLGDIIRDCRLPVDAHQLIVRVRDDEGTPVLTATGTVEIELA